MTLNQLKYAIAVSESDSFNVAARKLYISQPSLSTSIHALEEETGIQIFRRSQNGIAVTRWQGVPWICKTGYGTVRASGCQIYI